MSTFGSQFKTSPTVKTQLLTKMGNFEYGLILGNIKELLFC